MKRELFEEAMNNIDESIIQETVNLYMEKQQMKKNDDGYRDEANHMKQNMGSNVKPDRNDGNMKKHPEEKQKIKTKSKNSKWKLAIAVCLLLIAGIWGLNQYDVKIGNDISRDKQLYKTLDLLYGEVQLAKEKLLEAVKEEQLPESIAYTDLKLAEISQDIDGLDKVSGSFFTEGMDIMEFQENMLSNSDGIIEATVENAYVKQYSFEVADDKFEQDGTMRYTLYTMIYEVCINGIWYGNYEKGQKIILEEDCYGCVGDETIHLEIGRTYVLPIQEGNDTVFGFWENDKLISGNVQKESNLVTIYPCHRQIEVTLDHKYIAGSDWTTLTKEKNKSRIKMDKTDDNIERECYLYTEETFKRYMEKMIKKYLK